MYRRRKQYFIILFSGQYFYYFVVLFKRKLMDINVIDYDDENKAEDKDNNTSEETKPINGNDTLITISEYTKDNGKRDKHYYELKKQIEAINKRTEHQMSRVTEMELSKL